MNTYIHLLYVPTMACNMACSYCYLEDETKDLRTGHSALETLVYAVDKCRQEDIIPFNIYRLSESLSRINTGSQRFHFLNYPTFSAKSS